MRKVQPKKPRGKLFYGLCIFGILFIIGVIANIVENTNHQPPPRPSGTQSKKIEKSSPTPRQTSKTEKYRPPPPRPSATHAKIVFPKHFISLKDVKKHPQLKNDAEFHAYFYRYNQSAAAYYHKKPEKAQEYLQKFLRYKATLGEKRLDEIMILADSNYPF